MFTFADYDKNGNIPAALQSNGFYTASIVNEIFTQLPNKFRFTSGYRTPERNRQVNGAANSYHLTALAADFVPIDGIFRQSDAQQISNILSRYNYELIIHNAGSGKHYHIEPKNRNVYVADNNENEDNDLTDNSLYILLGLAFLIFLS